MLVKIKNKDLMKDSKYLSRLVVRITPFILVIFLALVSCKKDEPKYEINPKKSLEIIANPDYHIPLEDLYNQNHLLVDIRNLVEFERGHLENAINIYTPDLLLEDNLNIIKEHNGDGKSVIFYGADPHEALIPFMILNQMGIENLKIATIENHFSNNTLITNNIELEELKIDINSFIEESKKKVVEKPIIITKKTTPKKVVPIKKTKKMPVEGGC